VENNLISTSGAAKHLGVSKSTLYRMVDQGTLFPTKTPGGQRRFDISELDEYLEKSRTIKAPQNPSTADGGLEKPVDPRNKLNDLNGRQWMPLTKSYMYQKGLGSKHPHAAIERQHPAPFSFQDVMQLIEFFTKKGMLVLDPFGGVGSTTKAAAMSGRKSISIELQEKWHKLAVQRLESEVPSADPEDHRFINSDAREALATFETDSIDFIVTSPPYWSILNKKADHKVQKERLANNLATNYSDNDPRDLSNIKEYPEFLDTLVKDFFIPSAATLKTSKYMCLIVSDFRHKSKYVSFHSDLIQRLDGHDVGDNTFLALQGVKALIQNHKSLMPYGYPFAYVENIHHQYVLIFRKVKK